MRETTPMHLTETVRIESLRDGETFQYAGAEYLLLRGYRVNRYDGTRCLTVSCTSSNLIEDAYLPARALVLVNREQTTLSI